MRGLTRGEGGQALLEFALVFPLVLLLALAVVQAGWLAVGRQLVVYAAFMAARAAVVNPDRPRWIERAAQLALVPAAPRTSQVMARVPSLASAAGTAESTTAALGPVGGLLDRLPLAVALTRVDVSFPEGGGPSPGALVTTRVRHKFLLWVPLVNRIMGRPLGDLADLEGTPVGAAAARAMNKVETARRALEEGAERTRESMGSARGAVAAAAGGVDRALASAVERVRTAGTEINAQCLSGGSLEGSLGELRALCEEEKEALEGDPAEALGACRGAVSRLEEAGSESEGSCAAPLGAAGGLRAEPEEGCSSLRGALRSVEQGLGPVCDGADALASSVASGVAAACDETLLAAEEVGRQGEGACGALASHLTRLEEGLLQARTEIDRYAESASKTLDRLETSVAFPMEVSARGLERAEEATVGRLRSLLASLGLYYVPLEASFTLPVEDLAREPAPPPEPRPPPGVDHYCMHPASEPVRCFSSTEVEVLPSAGIWRLKKPVAQTRGLKGPPFVTCSCSDCSGWKGEEEEQACRASLRALRAARSASSRPKEPAPAVGEGRGT